MDLLAIASGVAARLARARREAEPSGLQINLFWVIVSALNFIFFAVILYWLFGAPPDADAERAAGSGSSRAWRRRAGAQRPRESAESERLATLQEARREANDILARAQKVAQDSRDADIAATKAELERLRERATAEIDAEKQRAIGELRGEVADLALAAPAGSSARRSAPTTASGASSRSSSAETGSAARRLRRRRWRRS